MAHIAVDRSCKLAAFLNARAVSALVAGLVSRPMWIANANAKSVDTSGYPNAKSAGAILDRNPFDHATGALRIRGAGVARGRASIR